MTSLVRVAVVDDHPIYRDGVVWTLNDSNEVDVISQGASADDAVLIAQNDSPDVILLDIAMPGCGLAAVKAIQSANSNVKTVMLTASENQKHLSAALRAGARGYILKGVTGPKMVNAVCSIHNGESYISPELATRVLANQNGAMPDRSRQSLIESLTPRENDIMREVAKGRPNKEVARELKLGEKTVKHYMTSILQKLEARNRVEAVLIYKLVDFN